jgi:DNA-binding transcriptional LysR family regulator
MATVDLRRLQLLLELRRRGSMRAVAEELGYTTSTVSEQLAVLAREAGTPLTERDGRRVRLTPAGRRLAEHAVTILAAVDAAKADLDPHAEPHAPSAWPGLPARSALSSSPSPRRWPLLTRT